MLLETAIPHATSLLFGVNTRNPVAIKISFEARATQSGILCCQSTLGALHRREVIQTPQIRSKLKQLFEIHLMIFSRCLLNVLQFIQHTQLQW